MITDMHRARLTIKRICVPAMCQALRHHAESFYSPGNGWDGFVRELADDLESGSLEIIIARFERNEAAPINGPMGSTRWR
jgi:hypothetical protein